MQLPGSERAPPPGATDQGPAPPDEIVEVTVLVRRRSDLGAFPDVLHEAGLPFDRRTRLDRGEFAHRYGAAPGDLDAVRRFGVGAGLRETDRSVGGRSIHLAGPVPAVERAFGTVLDHWSAGGATWRGRSGSITIPDSLNGVVLAVLGLDRRPQARSHVRTHVAAAPSDLSYAPPAVAAAYAFPIGTDGTGATIGILELGGGFGPGDLSAFFGGLGLPVPRVTVVGVDGATNAPTGDAGGPDGEVELDIEVAGSCAPGAHLAVYFAPNTDQGFLDALNAALHDAANAPSIVSISWGSPESSWTAQARSALNAALQDAAVMGVTVLVASGDQGANDGGASGSLNVDFPASSPYVLGCGGTRLVLSPTRSEVVWDEAAIGEGASGGGISAVFPQPTYQAGANVPAGPGGFRGRGVPDVAGDADPSSGYRVVVDGTATILGGTSAVAPLYAALFARINQALGAPVGYVTPLLYDPPESATFRDITSGSNDGYSAGPGWDPCTGWGSPDGAALLSALRGRAAAPT